MNSTKSKILLALSVVTFHTVAHAQSVTEIKKMYDYNRFETAQKMAEPLSATNAEANYLLGLSQIGLGKLADATATFAKFPEDAANISGAARVLFAQKKNVDAMAKLNALVSKAKKKDWQTYKLAADAITYSEGADYKKAVEWYTKANTISPNGETFMNLGDAYYNLPDGGGNAEVNYMKALDNKADGGLVAFRRGNLWYSARNYDSAISNYKRVTELDPNNPLPHLYFANSYYQKNRFAQAKESIEKYLKLSDNSTDDLLQYVNILYLSKDYTGAIVKINELITKGVEKPYLYRLAGFSNYENGANAEALKSMDTYFAKQTDKSKIIAMDYDYYSRILSKTTGREADAEKYFDMYANMDTNVDKSAIFRKKATGLYEAKEFLAADVWYEKLINKSKPEQVTSTDYFYYGFNNYVGKNYTKAISAYKTMTEKFNTEPSGFYYLGMSNALNSEKKNLEGAEAFKKYTELVGNDSSKVSQLKKAYSYIIEYYYNAKDATNAILYANKLLENDPANTYAPQIIEAMKGGGISAPPVPKEKPPVKKSN